MSKRDQSFKPLSLAQHFEAPDNFRGCFGWMCGYSADANFLDDAAERFTRQTHSQRAYGGHIALALMLDPGNSNISLVDAPAVMHLPIKNPDEKPFLLLHAKVAILWFRHESDAQRWQLRLIVSTGNWTRGTLEDSLDLVWRLDLSSEDLENPDAATHQACADIKAGWDMLKWLRDFFDTRILYAVPPGRRDGESNNAMCTFESWIEKVAKKRGGANSRFIDNRKQSFLSQLPELINATGVTVKRNYLAMGSGFYEAPSDNDLIPSVLRNIVDTLKKQQLLTEKPEVDVFVNPKACQAVATSLPALTKASFTVRPAGQPDYFGQNVQRDLHAKFVFSANYRNNSNLCNSAWLYLGSGNLTGPGFGNQMSKKGGNLEAGVVFAPTENLYWKNEKGLNLEQVISKLLPVQWEIDVNSLMNPLSAGADMPDRDLQFIAAPIAWLFWLEEADSSWLKAPEGTTHPFEILNEDGEACTPDAEGRYLWSGSRPRQAQLRWKADGETFQSAVPVLDEFGRLAATALSQIDLDEAWWQLANFPMPPDDDGLPPADDQDTVSIFSPQPAKPTSVATYPIRQMMQLIENIAAKQTAVSQIDWTAWCIRLEQCLVQTSGNSVLKAFTTLEINPLSPLWESSFRPTFAETNDTPEGARYEALLRRVEAEWDVASLRKIGCHDETKI